MEQEISIYKDVKVNEYSKLQEYDYSEFTGEKHQALKANFTSKKYEFVRFKSGYYDECIFDTCIFNAVGLSGTHFINCSLNNFEITDSNLQFCDFSRNSHLWGTKKTSFFISSNLSQSMFHDCDLRNILFKSTTISQARFINTSFKNVTWEACTLQDNVFRNVYMEDICLVGCNLEYSDFNEVRFKNVKLPLHQLPYTFGLLNALKKYPAEISIGSISSTHKIINTEEYIQLLPELFTYYISMNEYFPAINIALFLNKYERITELIEEGMKYYIQTNDFRKIKGICKLIANNSSYDREYLTKLYFKLVDYYNRITVSEYEKYQYSLHMNGIKEILTGFGDARCSAQLYLKTNIVSQDIEKLGTFYLFIEKCLENCGIADNDYTVEIRHNSKPLSFWITLSQNNPEVIVHAIGMIMAVITNNPVLLQNAIEVIANLSTIGAFAMQIGQAMKNQKGTTTSEYPDVAVHEIQYIKQHNEILKDKKISIEISLPFFNFSYQNQVQYKSQS